MNLKLRNTFVVFLSLGLLVGMSACQLGARGRLTNQATLPAEVQQSTQAEPASPTSTPVRPVVAPTSQPQPGATTGQAEATATAVVVPASPTEDSAGQAVSSSLDQLNQMNQSGDSFDDLP